MNEKQFVYLVCWGDAECHSVHSAWLNLDKAFLAASKYAFECGNYKQTKDNVEAHNEIALWKKLYEDYNGCKEYSAIYGYISVEKHVLNG